MRLHRSHLHRHALSLAALLAALLFPSACAGIGPFGSAPAHHTPSTTQPSATPPHIVIRSSSIQVPASAPSAQASAACQSGEQMIGGGFAASDTFEYDVKIASSYPSSASRWTVEATSSPAFTLQVDAYCLPANPTLGIQIVHAPIAPNGHVACLTSTYLLSGGFQSDASVAASRPESNGWSAATIGTSGSVFALCATQHISASTIASIPYNPHSTVHNYMPGSAEIGCPSGQTATAGGFSGSDLILASEASAPPSTRWTITIGGDADATLYAVCAILSA